VNLRLVVPMALGLALSATASGSAGDTAAEASDVAGDEQAKVHFPRGFWGVYGRNNHACRASGFAVEGKLGIRENKLILEGQPYELGEIHRLSDRMIVADFVAPGGWSTKGVRMSFQLLRDNKLWHATYEGKPAPKIGYYRCRSRKRS
jgi:hypothetical protein